MLTRPAPSSGWAWEEPGPSKCPTPTEVVRAVARHFEVVEDDLYGATRTHRICFVRKVAYEMLHHVCGLSSKEIGQTFFGRDHSTVCLGWNQIRLRIDEDRDLVPPALSARYWKSRARDRDSYFRREKRRHA